MDIERVLSDYLFKLRLQPEGKTVRKILRFLDIVYEKNRYLNLSGTSDKEQIFTRHFLDCLSIYGYLPGKSVSGNKRIQIIDIGSGAGLPGLLIGITSSGSEVTLIDSRKKITDFLSNTADELELANVRIVCGRAEQISHSRDYRESFDVVTARAVARVNILSELMIPLCKIGGSVFMYKSKKAGEELLEAQKAIALLGAEVEGLFRVDVPFLDEYRALLVLKKYKNTLYNYPRKYAKITKKPIV